MCKPNTSKRKRPILTSPSFLRKTFKRTLKLALLIMARHGITKASFALLI